MRKTYRGTIFSGLGVATTRVRQNLELYQAKTGMDLVPGTLNVELTEDFHVPDNRITISSTQVRPLSKKRAITLVRATMWGHDVIIMIPDPPKYGKHVIEVMASVNIRERFGLQDGDEVEIVLS